MYFFQSFHIRCLSTTISPYWVYDVCLQMFQLIGYTMIFHSYSTLLGIRCLSTDVSAYWVHNDIPQSFHLIGYTMFCLQRFHVIWYTMFCLQRFHLIEYTMFVYSVSTLLGIRCLSTVIPHYWVYDVCLQ